MKKIILSLLSGLLLWGCYDSMEVLPEEEMQFSSVTSGSISITYELSPNVFPDDDGITVSVPTPETVKQIILESFSRYMRVAAPSVYITTCYFTFNASGNISDVTIDLAMWDAGCRLDKFYGVGFVYYQANFNGNDYTGGWESGTDYGSGPSSGGSSGNSGSSSGNSSTDPDPVPVINPEGFGNDIVINLYEDFYDNSPTFQRVLKDFCAENSIVHLNWETNWTLAGNINGRLVRKIENYALTIELNGNKFTELPALIICKTMIHEAIHAKITLDLLKIAENPAGSSLPQNEFDALNNALTEQNFPTLFDYYQRYKRHASSQHEYMAAYYVETITKALHEFSSVNYAVAQAIAWKGLEGTKAWNALSEVQRKEYNSIYATYCEREPKLIEQ